MALEASRVSVGLSVLALALAACRKPTERALPARAQSLTEVARRVAQNRECEGCHATIAVEWRASAHRRAATNDAFREAFRSEPDPFCWACHAPESPDSSSEEEAAHDGVSCVTCHVDSHGAVHGASFVTAARAPHAVKSRDGFDAIRGCGACHEFAFPDPQRDRAVMMQTTLREHARSSHAARPCVSCHMPRTGADQHLSHAFAASRDGAALRQAVEVSAEREGTRVRIRIELRGVGHAFPTGDLFRRLRVTAEAREGERVVRRQQRYLARHFAMRRQRNGSLRREELYDDRPGARENEPTEVELELGGFASDRAIHWLVAYEHVQNLHGDGEDEAVVTSSFALGTGEIPP